MSKNAPKIILVVVCMGAAAGLLYYNMSGSGTSSSGTSDNVPLTAEEANEVNENRDEEEAPVLPGLKPDNF